jgi:hypothetical protein
MCVCSNREELLVNASEKSEHEKRVGNPHLLYEQSLLSSKCGLGRAQDPA